MLSLPSYVVIRPFVEVVVEPLSSRYIREILLEIKKSFKDVNNVLYDWTNSSASDYCMCRGVFCDNFTFKMVALTIGACLLGVFISWSEDICVYTILILVATTSLQSSSCSESQREAVLLLGQFAIADTDCKVHIVQRGAVGPLTEMLHPPDAQLREIEPATGEEFPPITMVAHLTWKLVYGVEVTCFDLLPKFDQLSSANDPTDHHNYFITSYAKGNTLYQLVV
ncbi:hypothetical protein E3N88_00031 [Mikania micrantha]|uniref:Leucine-rich repeat-containing N-terminal plant-type domain-containing protein n=1 Tax=Mikania micrantha TaxID=192012 RepID=A0A5N6PWX7_9ASTR|nr:hypothetical protein E3N88_00031 [Mikania micrantha]